MLARSIFDMFCLLECCSKFWVPHHIEELDVRLKKQLIGQPLAYDLVLRSIRSHVSSAQPSKSLVLSLHGSTGTGKNFVAKLIVESLYLEGFKSKYVRLYVVSRDFMHTDAEHIRQYKDRLTNDIETATRACPYATFIIDEIDQMPIQLLDVIMYYIDFHTPTSSQPIDFRRTMFIFLSNTGGQSIIQLANEYHSAAIARENYQILEFQKILSNASFHEQGGLWHASLIDRHLITFFVPFLPLEREHVRGCVEGQLEQILDQDEYQYELSTNDIIERVLELVEFTPSPSSPSLVYSVSGCKKVRQKLDYVFENIRPQLPKTKKPINELYDDL